MIAVHADIEWNVDLGDANALLLRWRDESGEYLDFTGYGLAVFDVSPELTNQVQVSWEDQTTGLVRAEIPSLKNVPLRKSMALRIAVVSPDGDRTKDHAFPRIRLVAR